MTNDQIKIVNHCINEHRKAFEQPTALGQMTKHWIDKDGYLCISYSNGTWYHYKIIGKRIEWW